jgi:hypothetical protein
MEGTPWPVAFQEKLFDGATLDRFRAFLPGWGAPAIGVVLLFHGLFSTVTKIGRTQAQCKIKTPLVWLAAQMPRNVWQPGCWYTLYGSQCGVNPAGNAVDGTPLTWTGAVGAGSTVGTIWWANTAPNNWFGEGTVAFTSGALAGKSYTVDSSGTWGFTPRNPLPALPAAGDGFSIRAGCDRSMGGPSVTSHDTPIHGCWKFDNLAKFPAFPFVPKPTTAL